MKLISILVNLKGETRPLTDEENLYLNQLGEVLRRAESDDDRWWILKCEGLNRINGFDFSEDILARLIAKYRAAVN